MKSALMFIAGMNVVVAFEQGAQRHWGLGLVNVAVALHCVFVALSHDQRRQS
jgi:hypothetical protein